MAPRSKTPAGQPARQAPRGHPRSVAAVGLSCVLATSVARGAPLYLSPRLDAAAGVTSNRFLDSRKEASPYLRLAPALEAVWFGPVDWEAGASAAYSTTQFTRTGFEHQDETNARAYLWRALPTADLTASVEGGTYRDRAVPDDDTTWMGAALTVRGLTTRQISPGITARLNRTRFDSRTAEGGDDRSDLLWSLAPELRWRLAPSATLWTGATLEGSSSNSEDGSYHGYGLSAGLDFQLRDTADAGLWARWEHRSHDDGRSANPAGAGAWGSLRLSTWAELTASTRYLDHSSTSELDDYREWVVEAGVRLRYDWPLVR